MEKICDICKQPFTPRKCYQRFCDRDHIIKCPICGKESVAKRDQLITVFQVGSPACSYKCRAAKTRQTSLEKYGCKAPGNNPEARKKASQTMMNKLGVPYAMMNSEVREKSKAKLIELYGVDNASKNAEILEKRIQTNHERYGDVLPFNTPESYKKQRETIMQRYGVRCSAMLPQVYNPKQNRSKINLEFKARLEGLGLKVELEKYLDGKYFDMEVIGRNLLIEINPTYTHSCIDHYTMKGLPRMYHKYKTDIAEANGYKCMHIWSWDKTRVIANQLLPRTPIDGKDMQVFRLSKEATDFFLKCNCVKGTCRNQALSLGLVKDDKIYQIITFGSSGRSSKYPIELMRACTRSQFEVIDGYDILTSAASRDFGVTRCVAYDDISKISDINYEAIGMKLDHISPPAKIWSKNAEYISDYLVQHPQTEYSEEDLLAHWWYPIYDCGQRVYVFE